MRVTFDIGCATHPGQVCDSGKGQLICRARDGRIRGRAVRDQRAHVKMTLDASQPGPRYYLECRAAVGTASSPLATFRLAEARAGAVARSIR